MTTISDIARAADVSVESVLRVLNRDEVSSDIASRVIAAMDAHGYGRLPRPETAGAPHTSAPEDKKVSEAARARARAVSGEIVEEGRDRDFETNDAIGRAREQLLSAVGEVVDQLENPESRGARPSADRLRLIEVSVDRLVRDVERMKRELAGARRERLEDLALLVDLITTSWRAVDRRLGRIDRKLERMEGFQERLGTHSVRRPDELRRTRPLP